MKPKYLSVYGKLDYLPSAALMKSIKSVSLYKFQLTNAFKHNTFYSTRVLDGNVSAFFVRLLLVTLWVDCLKQ